jgi:hypothetical protein
VKNILSLNFEEARSFLLKHESYVNIDLPPYIKFDKLLNQILEVLGQKNFIDFKISSPSDFEDVNYKLFHNKNGKYDWRRFELIHPFLYVSLVNEITKYKNWKLIKKRFGKNRAKGVVECMSLPVVSGSNKSDKAEQILSWWEQIEQKSITLSLDYSYIYHTDIVDCYGSIYTHSIPWALHSKKVSKHKRRDRDFNKDYIGGMIDFHIQSMSNGQTNGIPQGSVLMDLIAEIVLSYADLCLSIRLKHISKKDFYILRYRDDYRIFVNNPQIADEIIKILTEVLIDLGLKLNSNKTTFSNNVIQSSIKPDKSDWLLINKDLETTRINENFKIVQKCLLLINQNIIQSSIKSDKFDWTLISKDLETMRINENFKATQKYLLLIYQFALKYPHSGTIAKELQVISKQLRESKDEIRNKENIEVLMSIVVDIALLNPRTYSVSMAILSILFGLIDEKKIEPTVDKIVNKFNSIPNTGHMQIWLQRAIIKLQITQKYFCEPLCKLVGGESIELWNNKWLHPNNIRILENRGNIVNQDVLNALDAEIQDDEVLLFRGQSL